MLESPSGRWHSVFTGIALINAIRYTLKDFDKVISLNISELEIKNISKQVSLWTRLALMAYRV